MGCNVASRSTLINTLSRNPKFLYDELQEILVIDVRKAFRSKYENFVRTIKDTKMLPSTITKINENTNSHDKNDNKLDEKSKKNKESKKKKKKDKK